MSPRRFLLTLGGVGFARLHERDASVSEWRARRQIGHAPADSSSPRQEELLLDNPAFLEEALLELVGNALRATPAGGEVRLRLASEGASAVFHVADDGGGIPEAVQDRIFDQFETGRSRETNRAGVVAKGYWLALKAPFSSLAEKLRRKNFRRHYGPFIDILDEHKHTLSDKQVIVFYSNPFGQKYRNYPEGTDARLANVRFADIGLDWRDHYLLDGHLTPGGHDKVARYLADLIRDRAAVPAAAP